jgi:Neuraminidase (sialidase)
MKVKILNDVVVSPNLGAGEPRSCSSPMTCRLQNGDILCVYRRGTTKHSRDAVFIVQRSADAGHTWSDPIPVHDGMSHPIPESVHAGTVCQTQDGTVLAMFTAVEARDPEAYIFSETGRQLEQNFYIARSRDNGRTWTTPHLHVLPNTPSLRYINSCPLALSNGDILVPLEVTTAANRQVVMTSHYSPSKGTFEPFAPCAEDPTGELSFGDPTMTRLRDGRVLMWLWAFVNATEVTVQAHACVSEDEGRTWTKPWPTEICCQRSTLLSLGDRGVIVAANVRIPPEGIRLWSSRDSGKTWEDPEAPVQMWDARKHRMIGEPLAVRRAGVRDESDGKLWASLPGFTFGAPSLVLADERTMLLTYFAVTDGTEEVRACRFELVSSV